MIIQEEYEYRRSTMRVLLVVTIFAASFFAVRNWQGGWQTYAVVEGGVALFWCWLLAIVGKTPHLRRWSFIYLCSFYFIVLYGISTTTFQSGLFSWLFIFPILSYLLLGRKAGTLLTAISVFIGMWFLAQLVWQDNPQAKGIVMGNFGFSVIAIWSMVYVFEYKREAALLRLQKQATQDPLTGLLNMRTFDDIFASVLHSAKRRSELVSIAYIDLNDFKEINDTHGHKKGDEVLQGVAEAIKRITRAEDYAFRYGGDEFCIIFANCSQEQAQNTYGQRLAQEVHNKLEKLTMSIGYAQTGPSNYLSSDELIHEADQNMYAGKYEFKKLSK